MSSADDLASKLRKVAAQMVESGELSRLAMELANSGELAEEAEELAAEESEERPLGSTEGSVLVLDRYWQKRCEYGAKLDAEQAEVDTQRSQIKTKRATLRKTYEEQKGLLLAELLEPVTSQKLVVEEQLRGIESQVRACDENGARLRVELAKVDAAAWWRRIVGASALDAQRKKILVEQQALGAHRGELFHRARRDLRPHRPQRRGQDHHDGHHHWQDTARRRSGLLWQHHRLAALQRSRNRPNGHWPQVPKAHGL